MTKLLATVLVLLGNQAVLACEDFEIPAQFMGHWQKNRANHELPVGKIAVPQAHNDEAWAAHRPAQKTCRVMTDFNGDGRTDFAGIFHYRGEKPRSDDWSLDLVIMLTIDDRVVQVTFPYAGKLSAGGAIRFFLAPLAAGEVDLLPGTLTLDRPGVIAYRDGVPSVIYYWDGQTIAQQAIGVDD